MIFLIGAFGGIFMLYWSASHWRAAIKAALVVVVIEGVLRKWVLPQASELIYFLKDALLFGGYLGFFSKTNEWWSLRKPKNLMVLLGAAAFLIFIQIANPALNSFTVGLLGVKSYLLYVPLCFVLPSLFQTSDELQRFLQWYLLLAIPVCLLGAAQFYSSADSALNSYATSAVEMMGGSEREVETFGEEGNVRVTGTFPFLWGYSTYLTICSALVLASMVHQRNWTWRLISWAELMLIAVNMLMTGARSLILSTVLFVVGFLAFSMFEKNQNKRIVSTLILAMIACVVVSSVWFSEPVKAFFERTESSEDSLVARTLGPVFIEPWLYLDVSGVGGFGTASTQAAGWVLRQQLSLGPPAAVPPSAEGEPLRILLELGPLGLVFWLAMKITVVFLLFRTIHQLRTPFLRHLALAAFLIESLWLFTNAPVFNPTAGVYYWFVAGFIFLPQVERASMQKESKATKRAGRREIKKVSTQALSVV